MDTVGYEMRSALGASVDDGCVLLAQRFATEYGYWNHGPLETWIMRVRGGRLNPLAGGATLAADAIWLSPSGVLYVTTRGNEVVVAPSLDAPVAAWQRHPMPHMVQGVWGADDDLVFVWGRSLGGPWLRRWDGRAWHEAPCPGSIVAMHGRQDGDLVYAVGAKGLIARWDGASWAPVPSPTRSTLQRVFVAGPDKLYACGGEAELLEGSVYGWSSIVFDDEVPVRDVASHDGAVWVATDAGLGRLVRNRIEVVNPSLRAVAFHDAPGDLFFSNGDRIAQTSDGVAHRGVGAQSFADSVRMITPAWLTGAAAPWADDPRYVDFVFRLDLDANWTAV